jgi:hypothetical protein
MWILLAYFALFVLFCAANQYSWLQPSTGFRYLVPVVPGLALLAIQAAQALNPLVRRLVVVAVFAQSLIIAAAHENDLRADLTTLLHRRFALQWMIRLGRAGAPVAPWWTAAMFALLAAATAWIWLAPGPHRNGALRRWGKLAAK